MGHLVVECFQDTTTCITDPSLDLFSLPATKVVCMADHNFLECFPHLDGILSDVTGNKDDLMLRARSVRIRHVSICWVMVGSFRSEEAEQKIIVNAFEMSES